MRYFLSRTSNPLRLALGTHLSSAPARFRRVAAIPRTVAKAVEELKEIFRLEVHLYKAYVTSHAHIQTHTHTLSLSFFLSVSSSFCTGVV